MQPPRHPSTLLLTQLIPALGPLHCSAFLCGGSLSPAPLWHSGSHIGPLALTINSVHPLCPNTPLRGPCSVSPIQLPDMSPRGSPIRILTNLLT